MAKFEKHLRNGKIFRKIHEIDNKLNIRTKDLEKYMAFDKDLDRRFIANVRQLEVLTDEIKLTYKSMTNLCQTDASEQQLVKWLEHSQAIYIYIYNEAEMDIANMGSEVTAQITSIRREIEELKAARTTLSFDTELVG